MYPLIYAYEANTLPSKKAKEEPSLKKVLVLEDEDNIRSFIVINLRRYGYEPVEASTGEEALELLKQNPDVGIALLDVMLPGIDGFEVCRRIRASGAKIGIIMLTAKSQEMDKVNGLMTGADDYVTKPFSPSELIARLDALYRRLGTIMEDNSGIILSGPFRLNPGKALSRADILAEIWGDDYAGELKIVDVNIRRLRLKIEDDPTNPSYITTIWGFGYKWGS